MPTVSVSAEPWAAPDGAALRNAQELELNSRYGADDHEPGTAPSSANVPVFLVARTADGTAVACGGLRPLAREVAGENTAEIKRMYASPAARGTGAAVAVLHALEGAARELQLTRLVLETGTLQPDAIRFYEREGYHPIPQYGPYVGEETSVCFAKSLGEHGEFA